MNAIVTRDEVNRMLADILAQTGFTLEQVRRIILLLSELYPKNGWEQPKSENQC